MGYRRLADLEDRADGAFAVELVDRFGALPGVKHLLDILVIKGDCLRRRK